MIKNFEQLITKVKQMKNKTVVIAAAHTSSAIDAAIMAKKENIADSLLVGDKQYIDKYLHKNSPEFEN
ncbi:MAG: phosphate acetyltransferase, partial [Candidatus Cloacimonetes bacterium]|nr:phosphate acetyltransferase [Candidatus Cloacimonadota bacterium]